MCISDQNEIKKLETKNRSLKHHNHQLESKLRRRMETLTIYIQELGNASRGLQRLRRRLDRANARIEELVDENERLQRGTDM